MAADRNTVPAEGPRKIVFAVIGNLYSSNNARNPLEVGGYAVLGRAR